MKIGELFKELENKITFENLKGEITLNGNCIVWLYNLDESNLEASIPLFNYEDNDEDIYEDTDYDSSITTTEEQLINLYREDLDKIQLIMDGIGELECWLFSEPDIIDNAISFKIF